MIESKATGRETKNGNVGRNLTTHSTGARVSWSFIVDLCVPALNARPVNSGVRLLTLAHPRNSNVVSVEMNPELDPDDDEDNLPVPAGVVRVVLGLVVMLSGVLMAAIFQSEWIKGLGLIIFLLSPFIMLKWPKREYK